VCNTTHIRKLQVQPQDGLSVNVGVDNNIHSARIGAQIVRMRRSRIERILWQKVEFRKKFSTVDAVKRPFELRLSQLKLSNTSSMQPVPFCMLHQKSAASTDAPKFCEISRALSIVYVYWVPRLLCKLRLSMKCNEHIKAIAFSNIMLSFFR
jgi:hypothetical protein